MNRVLRYDSGTASGPVRMDNGWLRAACNLTRSGIFEYLNQDGSKRLEYRPPEEVFNQDSMDSFDMVPVTVGHPDVEVLDSRNAKSYSAGSVSKVRQDGNNLAAMIMLTDEDAILAVEAGMKFLSCGYHVDLDETPGVTTEGNRYDAVQRGIRGNHVALVSRPRAGETAVLRLDGNEGKMKMKKFNLDGIDLELDEVVAAAIQHSLTKRDNELATAKAEISKQAARADKAEEDMSSLKKVDVKEMVKGRLSIIRSAEKLLPSDHTLKLDEMSDNEIKKAAVLAKSPAAKEKIEKADDSYVNARFDSAVESAESEPNEALDKMRSAGGRLDGSSGEDELSTARRAMVENQNKNALSK